MLPSRGSLSATCSQAPEFIARHSLGGRITRAIDLNDSDGYKITYLERCVCPLNRLAFVPDQAASTYTTASQNAAIIRLKAVPHYVSRQHPKLAHRNGSRMATINADFKGNHPGILPRIKSPRTGGPGCSQTCAWKRPE